MTEATQNNTPDIGAKMPDGSIYAGLTKDGAQQIYAAPADIGLQLTFNEAAKAVEKLNSDKFLGHDDWQIASMENLRVLSKNQNEGFLKGSFVKAAAFVSGAESYPEWYWSSTMPIRNDPDTVWGVRIVPDGHMSGSLKNFDRQSCRPLRLVAAPGAGNIF